MIKNPYDILGVNKTADEKEIKSAYRKLAKQHHPDLNPSDKNADEKFKEISVAYDLLQDKDKRAAYDRGEIDFEGNQQQHQQQQSYKDFADGPQGQRYYSTSQQHFNPEDLESIFGAFFKDGAPGAKAGFKAQPADAHYAIDVEFLEAATGTKKQITMPDGKALKITIPPGTQSGQKLRLKGQGNAGNTNTPASDAYIEIHVKPHSFFNRKGKDINVEVPIAIQEAVLGGKIEVPTVHGKVEVSIPKNATTGTKLRLKGKGIDGGNQYVSLVIAMPDTIDDDLKEIIGNWAKKHSYNPRKSEVYTS